MEICYSVVDVAAGALSRTEYVSFWILQAKLDGHLPTGVLSGAPAHECTERKLSGDFGVR